MRRFAVRPDDEPHHRVAAVRLLVRNGTATVRYCAGSPSAGYIRHHGNCACMGAAPVSKLAAGLHRARATSASAHHAQGAPCKSPAHVRPSAVGLAVKRLLGSSSLRGAAGGLINILKREVYRDSRTAHLALLEPGRDWRRVSVIFQAYFAVIVPEPAGSDHVRRQT